MKVLYFAWIRERVGAAEEEVTPPAEVKTAGDLLNWLRGRDAAHAEALADDTLIRVAIDREHADLDSPVAGAAEVAFFPPVTGG